MHNFKRRIGINWNFGKNKKKKKLPGWPSNNMLFMIIADFTVFEQFLQIWTYLDSLLKKEMILLFTQAISVKWDKDFLKPKWNASLRIFCPY